MKEKKIQIYFTLLQPKTSEIRSLSISENTLFANELTSIKTI
jgi:hypothetical protein